MSSNGNPAAGGQASAAGGLSASSPKFHRVETSTQTVAHALLQVRSGEIWGRAARWSSIPSVKAYRNQMPAGHRGIEFTTSVAPHVGSGSPFEARWYYPHTPGVMRRTNAHNEEFAAIPASVINLQP